MKQVVRFCEICTRAFSPKNQRQVCCGDQACAAERKRRQQREYRELMSRRRPRRVRGRTVAMKRLQREAEFSPVRIEGIRFPEDDYWRPRTRRDCATFERPCPYVACAYHLYLDVSPKTGSIKFNFPDLEPWELEDTCVLDVADACDVTLERIGELMNLTRERVRQLELCGLARARGEVRRLGLSASDLDAPLCDEGEAVPAVTRNARSVGE
jgi:hypothetical protein